MASLKENIDQAIFDFDAIQEALIQKGANIDSSTPTKDYGKIIEKMEDGGITGPEEPDVELWQPHPDWWDLEEMLETGYIGHNHQSPENFLYAYVITDQNDITEFPPGSEYHTSDMGSYSGDQHENHHWNRYQDKPCEEGYSTRAIVVCGGQKELRQFIIPDDCIYIYFGNCFVNGISGGKNLRAIRVTEDTQTDVNFFDEIPPVLEYLEVPVGMEEINLHLHPDANSFYLKQIILPEGLKTINEMAFVFCHSLNYIYLPDSITAIKSSAFQDCHSLPKIRLPLNLDKIGQSVFLSCTNLQSIHWPDSLKEIESSAFENCSSLEAVQLPEGLTTIGKYAFSNCSALKSIGLPKSLSTIGESAFQSCTSLQSIQIPQNVTYLPNDVFRNCYSLQNFQPPKYLSWIGQRTFQNCCALKSVDMSEISTIGNSAFYGCGLKHFHLNFDFNGFDSFFDKAELLRSIKFNQYHYNDPIDLTDCPNLYYIETPYGFRNSLVLDSQNLSVASLMNIIENYEHDCNATLTIGPDNIAKIPEYHIEWAKEKGLTLE